MNPIVLIVISVYVFFAYTGVRLLNEKLTEEDDLRIKKDGEMWWGNLMWRVCLSLFVACFWWAIAIAILLNIVISKDKAHTL